jgi:ornithine cyclodeaminase/alanine dehydrogenase-like protein (mu-crystallin family)
MHAVTRARVRTQVSNADEIIKAVGAEAALLNSAMLTDVTHVLIAGGNCTPQSRSAPPSTKRISR